MELSRPRSEDGQGAASPVAIRGRRSRNWPYEASATVAGRAGRVAEDAVTRWGYKVTGHQVQAVVELLFRAAAEDGGRRLSVHLADDEDRSQVLVLVISHRQDMPVGDDDQVLREAQHMRTLASLGPRDVGVETTSEGRRWWAGLDLPRPGVPCSLGNTPARAISRGPRKLERPPVSN
ncbi:hypothetical protein ACFWVP_28860 [Streptomyces sp. NPDC058637]|uniref:hypothetical protein n=1 Tax=Streptomyces sp. NPDC058637 TaxID=3346569 RepID=UPI003654A0A6